jgi:phosphoesterase RecJ-like protein
VDCADLQRLGSLIAAFSRTEHTMNIDHHMTNNGFAELNWIEPDASSTGILVYELIKALGVEMNRDMALCTFVAISSDTGHFTYSNTSSVAFLAASELSEYELDIPAISNRLYRARSYLRTRLLGIILSRVELFSNDSVGISYVTREELNAHGGRPDMEGMIEFIRDIDSVETAILLRETEKGLIRVSMRSKRKFDVGAFAARLGGGGHQRAAGCTLNGELFEIRDLLLKQVHEAIV